MNHTIDARGQSDEPGMAQVAIVKRKSKSKKTYESTGETLVEVITEVVSKKRPTVESDEPVVPKKRRTTKSKASSSKASLDIVNIAQDVLALQIVEPTPAATAEKSPLPKRKSKKRRLVLSKGSDDENVEEQESVKNTVAVLEETYKLATDEAEQREQHLDEPEVGDIDFGDSPVKNADDFEQWLDKSFEDFVETESVDKTEGSKEVAVAKTPEKAIGRNQTDEIRFGSSIEINEVQDRDWYYVSLPRISTHDKGKEPLEEDEPVKGNPARETVELICGDVEFLVQMCDQVMQDVVAFFHSFSLNKLSDLDSLKELKEKEKHMLLWAEANSLETAVKRRVFILAKYREMLLRKFLDSHHIVIESEDICQQTSIIASAKVSANRIVIGSVMVAVIRYRNKTVTSYSTDTVTVSLMVAVSRSQLRLHFVFGVARSSPGARLGERVFVEGLHASNLLVELPEKEEGET
ncbi:hypothetical protein F511_33467 [Dorcoceras hygrometricum]|uniref:Uncharacterized protein n=1 Tax=Dorcoceras hygrometricum TaxID=472368 RepID=A0A2Z7BA86_9LAMI|nr:hypothetical protein F511_33467 [Dorcoceras hygrometricum]